MSSIEKRYGFDMGARGLKIEEGRYLMRCMACGKYQGYASFEYTPNWCDACNRFDIVDERLFTFAFEKFPKRKYRLTCQRLGVKDLPSKASLQN